MKLLLKGGTATRKACGAMMRRKVWKYGIPMEKPASHCPLGTDKMAARTVSEPYAPTFSEKAITAAVHGSKLMPTAGSP